MEKNSMQELTNYVKGIVPFISNKGFIKHPSGVIDGNAAGYTGLHYIILRRLGYTERTLFCDNLKQIELTPGVIERAEKPGDRQAHDDYVYMVCASNFEDGGGFARRVLARGRAFGWYFNNNDINLKPSILKALLKRDTSILRRWFARIPGFVGITKLAAGKSLGPLDTLLLAIDLLSTSYKNDGTSGHLMDWVKCAVIEDKGGLILKYITSIVRKRLLKQYSGGIKGVLAEYFTPDYPMAKYAK